MLVFLAKRLFKAGRKIMKKELAEILEKEIGRLNVNEDKPARRRQESLTDVIAPANNTEFYRLIIVVLIAVVIVKLF